MKERPIICRDDEVRAFLEGRKTQLRRPIVGPDTLDILFDVESGEWYCDGGKWHKHCPFGVVGDRLWVRECFATVPRNSGAERHVLANDHDEQGVRFRATWDKSHSKPWRSSSQMPRWASRITLEITGVRVERLQDITEKDATLEGFEMDFPAYTARGFFCDAWDIAYGGRDRTTMKPIWSAWVNNPFVWVIGVEVRNDGG